MKIEWSQFYLNQIIYTEEIGATVCRMKLSPERHVFYLFQINFTTTRIQVCQRVPSNSFTTVEFDSVIILFESNNNWTRSIINCKVSACSSSELNLRSPHLRFYLFQIKVQWGWTHLFTPKHTLTAQLTSVQKSIRILFVSNKTCPKISGVP